MGNSSRSHHLLKHSLPEVDVLHHFGSIEPKEVSREINKLGQRDLQVRGDGQDSLRSSTSPTPFELCLTLNAPSRRPSSGRYMGRKRIPITTAGCVASSWKVSTPSSPARLIRSSS